MGPPSLRFTALFALVQAWRECCRSGAGSMPDQAAMRHAYQRQCSLLRDAEAVAGGICTWPPGASSVSSMTARYYLSESRSAGRKVFFDFATLPERAISATGADSNGYPARFNGCGKFVISGFCL